MMTEREKGIMSQNRYNDDNDNDNKCRLCLFKILSYWRRQRKNLAKSFDLPTHQRIALEKTEVVRKIQLWYVMTYDVTAV
jgi:hypothetical protein